MLNESNLVSPFSTLNSWFNEGVFSILFDKSFMLKLSIVLSLESNKASTKVYWRFLWRPDNCNSISFPDTIVAIEDQITLLFWSWYFNLIDLLLMISWSASTIILMFLLIVSVGWISESWTDFNMNLFSKVYLLFVLI